MKTTVSYSCLDHPLRLTSDIPLHETSQRDLKLIESLNKGTSSQSQCWDNWFQEETVVLDFIETMEQPDALEREPF